MYFQQPMYTTKDNSNHKFDPRARRCFFIGYPPNHKGYKIYGLEDNTFLSVGTWFFMKPFFFFMKQRHPYILLSIIPK